MAGDSITGEQLFLRYAWPCAGTRLVHKLITNEDFELLRRYLEDPTANPPIEILIRCFPNAAAGLLEKSSGNGTTPWSKENVARYWHSHRGEHPACAVWQGTVFEVWSKDRALVFLQNGLCLIAKNPYSLPLTPHAKVFVHRETIIEFVS